MADESTIETSYIPQSWDDNVIISDTRMNTIENGIVNLYTAIFGTNKVQDVEPIFDKIDDLWNNIGKKNEGEESAFDEIHSLKNTKADKTTTDSLRTDLGNKTDTKDKETAFGKIKNLENNLGNNTTNASAFERIKQLEDDLGTKGANSAFSEINNINTNINTINNNISTLSNNLGEKSLENKSAFAEINALNTNKADSSVTKAIRNDLGTKNDQSTEDTAFGRIASLEESVTDITIEGIRQKVANVLSDESIRTLVPYRSVQILLDEAQYRQSLLNLCYPIGSIYITMAPTNPSNFLGGKWVEWSQGRVIIGAKDETITINDASFDLSAGSTGGEYSHTLTIDEMPSHTHAVASYNNNSETSGPVIQSGEGRATSKTDIIQEAGGSQAHSIIQPYVSCYIWKRVAEDITELVEAIGNNTYTGIFKAHDIIPMKLKDGSSMDLEIIDIDSENNQVKLVSVDVIEDSSARYEVDMETGTTINELPTVLENFQNSKIPDDLKEAIVNNNLWIPTREDVNNINIKQKKKSWWIIDDLGYTRVNSNGTIEEGTIIADSNYMAFGITITSLQPYVNIPTDATGNLF